MSTATPTRSTAAALAEPADPATATAPIFPRPIRVVTAASLFDGHEAAIHVMRRILQASGTEVIHLGRNRSVKDLVDAAVQEDVQAMRCPATRAGTWSSSATWWTSCARTALGT